MKGERKVAILPLLRLVKKKGKFSLLVLLIFFSHRRRFHPIKQRLQMCRHIETYRHGIDGQQLSTVHSLDPISTDVVFFNVQVRQKCNQEKNVFTHLNFIFFIPQAHMKSYFRDLPTSSCISYICCAFHATLFATQEYNQPLQ